MGCYLVCHFSGLWASLMSTLIPLRNESLETPDISCFTCSCASSQHAVMSHHRHCLSLDALFSVAVCVFRGIPR
eukprot:superscaffoldBa00000405_g4462